MGRGLTIGYCSKNNRLLFSLLFFGKFFGGHKVVIGDPSCPRHEGKLLNDVIISLPNFIMLLVQGS